MARYLILLAAVLLTTGCASELVIEPDGALAAIPRQTSRSGHIVVETLLNGEGPFRFALDTGATISVVYDKDLKRSGIDPLPEVRVRVRGITGTSEVPVADVASISVGKETWENARVALLPDTETVAQQIDGILGIDFLQKYAIWYSQRDEVLRLYPKEVVSARSYNGWTSIKLSELGGTDGDHMLFVFDIVIKGERFPTLFDLGATVNIMNMNAARRLDITMRKPEPGTEVIGIVGGAPVLAVLRVWRLRVGSNYWRNRVFLVGEFPIFEILEIDTRPAIIAGADFFGDSDFIIDFAQKRLLVRQR
jgi:predicted aspartyl protease